MTHVETLTLAVCMSHGVALSDFIPCLDILSSVNMEESPLFPRALISDVKYKIDIDYIAPKLEPIQPLTGIKITVNPSRTYKQVEDEGIQYDIIWVPAGRLPMDRTAPSHSDIPVEQIDFIRKQAPKAKYIVSVCVGAVQLAAAGVLDGKRATTSKYWLKDILARGAYNKVKWVKKARWVVDGNIWTSSGVAAGSDMTLSFLEHLTSKPFAEVVRSVAEVVQVTSEDDPFAESHGLA